MIDQRSKEKNYLSQATPVVVESAVGDAVDTVVDPVVTLVGETVSLTGLSNSSHSSDSSGQGDWTQTFRWFPNAAYRTSWHRYDYTQQQSSLFFQSCTYNLSQVSHLM